MRKRRRKKMEKPILNREKINAYHGTVITATRHYAYD